MVRTAMTGMRGVPAGRQRQSVTWLRERVGVVEAECRAVRAERDQLAGQVERLAGENQRLQTLGKGTRRTMPRTVVGAVG
jgi:hypothetical protein